MKKFNNFKNSDAVSLDFDKIDAEIIENINEEVKKRRKIKYGKRMTFSLKKALSYGLCIMLTCIVSVGSTLLIQGSMLQKGDGTFSAGVIEKPADNFPQDGNPGNAYPGKNKDIIERYFDNFVAFCGGPREQVHLDKIIKTNLISEQDKSALKAYDDSVKVDYEDSYYKELFDENGKILVEGNREITDEDEAKKYYNDVIKNSSSNYSIYFGEKSGKDIVVFTHMSNPYKIFVFESKIDYKFTDIIKYFENISGEKLSREFLSASAWFEDYRVEMGGITLRFVENYSKKAYTVYYSAIINGILYTLTENQLRT